MFKRFKNVIFERIEQSIICIIVAYFWEKELLQRKSLLRWATTFPKIVSQSLKIESRFLKNVFQLAYIYEKIYDKR